MQRPMIENLGYGFFGNGRIVLLKGVDHEPGGIRNADSRLQRVTPNLFIQMRVIGD
jgi:hypothetical protein